MDWNYAATLLLVAEKSRQWPELKRLENAALAELAALTQPSQAPRAVPMASVLGDDNG